MDSRCRPTPPQTPWSDGTSHLLFTPGEFLEKLSTLIPKRVYDAWSKVLAKVFKLDVTTCSCGGDFVPICAVTERDAVKRYLEHIGIDSDPPEQAPPKRLQESFDFSGQEPNQDDCPVTWLD